MTKALFTTAFLIGAAAILWMCAIFVGTHAVAFVVTALIGCGYVLGALELVKFRQASATLRTALNSLPAVVEDLSSWLNQLDPGLQNTVQLRIEGERVGLPAPVLTPYLVGLLVMLGLLGTFIGMVDTLQGAVTALEGSSELEAIRAGLAAPIKGLGLAFGTSVAGVGASAMLGLMSTLSRRERIIETRRLDSSIAGAFRNFSLVHNRQQTYKALQMQAQALPEVAEKLNTLAGKLERMGDGIGASLEERQQAFHQSVQGVYTELAESVNKSLTESVAQSGRVAFDSIKPIVTDVMQELVVQISSSTQATHTALTATAQRQLETLCQQFENTSSAVAESWQSGLASQQRELSEALQQTSRQIGEHTQASSSQLVADIGKLLASSEQLVEARVATEAAWVAAHNERMGELGETMSVSLGNMAAQEERRGEAAVERLAALEATVATHLLGLGKELEAPMARLIETASETPRAAAEVIGQLRQEISSSIERDNQLLQERQDIMAQLSTLSSALAESSNGQRLAMENLVQSSATMLERVGESFTDKVVDETSRLGNVAENFATSATEMASLGEAFGLAVQLFNQSNQGLVEHLVHIEQAMEQSSARSDEQLGYYVAQAREIIDHSIVSQQQMIEALRQLGQPIVQSPGVEEVGQGSIA